MTQMDIPMKPCRILALKSSTLMCNAGWRLLMEPGTHTLGYFEDLYYITSRDTGILTSRCKCQKNIIEDTPCQPFNAGAKLIAKLILWRRREGKSKSPFAFTSAKRLYLLRLVPEAVSIAVLLKVKFNHYK